MLILPRAFRPCMAAADAARAGSADATPISLVEAMTIGRRSVALFTELAIDTVSGCERHEIGWRVIVEAIEAPARLGDNDLLARYEVVLSDTGEVTAFNRLARYKREDGAA